MCMNTRLGTKYQKFAPQTSPTMESSLDTLIRTMSEQLNQMKDQNQDQFAKIQTQFFQMNQTNT